MKNLIASIILFTVLSSFTYFCKVDIGYALLAVLCSISVELWDINGKIRK